MSITSSLQARRAASNIRTGIQASTEVPAGMDQSPEDEAPPTEAPAVLFDKVYPDPSYKVINAGARVLMPGGLWLTSDEAGVVTPTTDAQKARCEYFAAAGSLILLGQ